jgi:tRNA dimethylallyltransferase
MSERTARAILIAGPTASGKSALAMALAERLAGTVINADSMQVYRDLPILTARPSAEDEARVPHALYGFVPGSEAYSAARYAADAARTIELARAAGRRPIVVGGTGLYFKVLLEGLSPIPAIPEDVRAHWRREAQRIGATALHALLAERDPVMAARLFPTDPQRIVRALEVLEATGRSLAEWQQLPGEPVLGEEDTLRFVVAPPRDALHRRSDARFEAMMAAGALAEVEALAGLGLDPELPVMRALAVRPLMQLVSGSLTREDAVEAAKAETRQYIKRQVSWIRSNMKSWKALDAQETKTLETKTMTFIDY